MVMVSARLTRRWRLSYRHDLTNAAINRKPEFGNHRRRKRSAPGRILCKVLRSPSENAKFIAILTPSIPMLLK